MNRIFSNEKKAISPVELNAILNNYELCTLMNNLSNEDFKVLGKLFNNIGQGDFCLIINSLNGQTTPGIQPPKYESNNHHYQQHHEHVNGNGYHQKPAHYNKPKKQYNGSSSGPKQHQGRKYQRNGNGRNNSQGKPVYATINTNGYNDMNGRNGRNQHGNRQLELPYYE